VWRKAGDAGGPRCERANRDLTLELPEPPT